jgi:DNA-binding beta-propeller fold protein YncE
MTVAPERPRSTVLTIPPSDVAVDSVGNVYVADLVNNRVLKLPAG